MGRDTGEDKIGDRGRERAGLTGPRSVSSLFFGSAETDTNIPPSWNSPFFHRYCTDAMFWVEYIHIRFGEPIKITR